jgi:hypothetical protein
MLTTPMFSKYVLKEPFHGHDRVKTVGWSFSLFPLNHSALVDDDVDSIISACGPVITQSQHEAFVGASQASLNVAEISAVIEFCLWGIANAQLGLFAKHQYVRLMTSSKYIKLLFLQHMTPSENVVRIKSTQHFQKQVGRYARVGVFWGRDVTNGLGGVLQRIKPNLQL